MLKLGIIGTNWITQQFIDAAVGSTEWQLTTVYSRHAETARAFADKNHADEIFTDLDAFFSQGSFDTVYIASPNSLHFAQAKQAIAYGKHVIVEKPAVANQQEFEQLDAVLKAHPDVLLFEAARQIHEVNFQRVKDQIKKLSLVQGATLTYMKYSSRYDAVLAGEEPNIFSLNFAGGALQDLGVYLAYDAVGWFGMPEEVAYYPTLTRTGVDGKGVAILRYADFTVTLNVGKTSNSFLPSEINGLRDAIVMDNPAELGQVTYQDKAGQAHDLGVQPDANPMLAEARDFAAVINDPTSHQAEYLAWRQLSRNVNKLLFNLRQSGHLYFTGEAPETDK
ncbi:Gfo/Idh/MocA family protein [Lactiplantibacillus paraplantarum]|uniref:Gfo/Idh/MocA family protein n=1 Tax=Lactiplantibacillus paraplantarum TaxID=60520 RepID=UPI00148B137D|nr:Gfo/Idh/MocA family oxidoreductase [Lactiplantibacillus paraplantarum]QJU49915.1 putative oxidoreductase YgjR [Lactiplantibacillus paraplantarum]UKB42222.1 Gfo/Idh/MocA family oxidoreductase [Lactiplantibacillus paraplantarum]